MTKTEEKMAMSIIVLALWFMTTMVMMCIAVDKYRGINKKYVETYMDACHMSDLIRCYKDHLTSDSLIEDYGCFEELEQQFLNEDGKVNLADYSFCY